jgi:hypothetical protein
LLPRFATFLTGPVIGSSPGNAFTGLHGLHHRNQADGEQRQATDISGGEHEPSAVNGFARPDFPGLSRKIKNQFVRGNLRVYFRIGPALSG